MSAEGVFQCDPQPGSPFGITMMRRPAKAPDDWPAGELQLGWLIVTPGGYVLPNTGCPQLTAYLNDAEVAWLDEDPCRPWPPALFDLFRDAAKANDFYEPGNSPQQLQYQSLHGCPLVPIDAHAVLSAAMH